MLDTYQTDDENSFSADNKKLTCSCWLISSSRWRFVSSQWTQRRRNTTSPLTSDLRTSTCCLTLSCAQKHWFLLSLILSVSAVTVRWLLIIISADKNRYRSPVHTHVYLWTFQWQVVSEQTSKFRSEQWRTQSVIRLIQSQSIRTHRALSDWTFVLCIGHSESNGSVRKHW